MLIQIQTIWGRSYHEKNKANSSGKKSSHTNAAYQSVDEFIPLLTCRAKACSLDEMRTHPKIGHWYNDDIDESSEKRTIRRDLEKLMEILGTGHLQTIKGNGNQPDQYSLEQVMHRLNR
ncbi:MAG: hypothetical protein U1F13_06815 [Acinetobacter parvus]